MGDGKCIANTGLGINSYGGNGVELRTINGKLIFTELPL
jgi:hypothetical protein